MAEASPKIDGFFDGYRGGAFEGWAWRPDDPDQPLVIEVYANGFRLGETEASLYRPDLRAAGVGHGRFGFSLPFPIDMERSDPVHVSVRIKDGPPLAGGETTIGGAEPLSEDDAAAFQAFVAAVLGQTEPREDRQADPSESKTHFIVYCPTGVEAKAEILGAAEYSYAFVLKAFIPVLERFGEVHVVDDPARQVDLLYEAHLLKGETTLFLSFAPPHRTTLGLRCPVIPVIAWEYPTIPSEVWDGWLKHDWRWVLRQCGRAVTLSQFAAQAIKAAMGSHFPVIALPAPVWDRRRGLCRTPVDSSGALRDIRIDGFVFDSRGVEFGPAMTTPRPPREGELPDRLELDGVVFTSVFSPMDGRKNWPDLVTAFLSACVDCADATLVLKMVGQDPEQWWWELFDRVSRMPPFSCRLVVLNGFLDDQCYADLIAASHWVVNSSSAEGLCLPLIEFMCAERPAIAPRHTAMLDYLDATCALVVHSDEQYCGWPHDGRMGMTTTRHQVSWSALKDAYREGYRLVKQDPETYRGFGLAAAIRMEAFCNDEVVADGVSSFLGLGHSTKPASEVSTLLKIAEST